MVGHNLSKKPAIYLHCIREDYGKALLEIWICKFNFFKNVVVGIYKLLYTVHGTCHLWLMKSSRKCKTRYWQPQYWIFEWEIQTFFFCYIKPEPTGKIKTKALCLLTDSAIPITVEFQYIATITRLEGKEVLMFASSQTTNQGLKNLRLCLLYQIHTCFELARQKICATSITCCLSQLTRAWPLLSASLMTCW